MFKIELQPYKEDLWKKGFSFNEALDKAYKVLDFGVMKQSAVLSYIDIFLYLGVLFLVCIPITLLIKRSKKKVDLSEAMH